jgi:outer membrane lipoprotein-sorting protein
MHRYNYLLALLLALTVLPARAFDLSALMALLGQQRGGEAAFSEQRFVKGLDEPLTASGTLSFAAPDRFVRTTLKPRAETMAVAGNTVTLTRGGRSRSFTLDAAPEMVGIVEAIRGTLTGNLQTVQRYFKPELSGSAEQWTLALTPLEARLGGQVRVIHIGGRRAEVNRIEMQLTDGDRSLMSIEPARAGSASPAASAP